MGLTNRVWVGNVPADADEKTLEEHFAAVGVCKAYIPHRGQHRSPGFAFLEFESQAEAAAAIDKLDGTVILGRRLKVNVAFPPQEGERR